jgi:hypothetical protein
MRSKILALSVPAAAIATLVFAVAVELVTRATWNSLKGTPGFFLSDPVRLQRLAPGYRGWFAGVPVVINQLGFRDNREYALDKSPRTLRILVLGDSVTFGHGSVFEHTYPYLLEQRLRAWRPDVDWQVWNAAVPGYNTSQELAHLLEVGPRFRPDLVVVGFFENDVVDNFPVVRPGPVARMRSAVISWLYRHVYSIELYKRLYLQLAWRMSGSNGYRLRLDHLGEERQLFANVQKVQDLEDQRLTPFDRLDDDRVASASCPDGPQLKPDVLDSMQREPGFGDWLAGVRRLQQLNRDGVYRIVFFVNVAPIPCWSRDIFYDGGSAALNRYHLETLGDGTPAVSMYDALRHARPSQMPLATGHALGNTNALKADVLFQYLRDEVLTRAPSGRIAAILRSVPAQ